MTKPRKTRPNGVAREDILAAATRLFADRGYAGVTLRMIAEKAKVHLPAIYNNFENKRMLYVACCINVFTRSTNEVAEKLRDDATDEENILAFATEMCRLNIGQPLVTKLAQRQALDNDRVLIDLIGQTAAQGYHGRVVEAVGRVIGKESAARVTFAIMALSFGAFQLSVYTDRLSAGDVMPTKVDSLTAFVLDITLPQVDWAAVRKRRASRDAASRRRAAAR